MLLAANSYILAPGEVAFKLDKIIMYAPSLSITIVGLRCRLCNENRFNPTFSVTKTFCNVTSNRIFPGAAATVN